MVVRGGGDGGGGANRNVCVLLQLVVSHNKSVDRAGQDFWGFLKVRNGRTKCPWIYNMAVLSALIPQQAQD